MIEQICIDRTLIDSAKEVFETMIFMDLEECCDHEQHVESDVLLGSITFRGKIDGCFAICCSTACARAIGTNMLGMDSSEEIKQEDICDAIGEVTNMIMGSIKTRIQDCVGNVHVSIPMVVSGQEIETTLGIGTAKKVFAKVSIDSEYIADLVLLYKEGSE